MPDSIFNKTKDYMILNCEDFVSTIKSISSIFNISESELIDVIDSWEEYSDESPLSEECAKRLYLKFGKPSPHLAIYFHGTRVGKSHTFETEGILPKTKAAKLFGNLYTGGKGGCKDTPRDEGPFGFLIKELHLNHHYISHPELIADQNSKNFSEEFLNSTRPCIIAFIAEPQRYHLETAIWYVYLKLKSGDLNHLGSCHDAKGVTIPPERIISIDENVFSMREVGRIASLVRGIFEDHGRIIYSENSSLRQSIFPNGCCGDASRILASILASKIGLRTDYWIGYFNGEKSHAWIQAGKFVIDITADQFNNEYVDNCAVIVSDCSKFHNNMTSKQCLGNGDGLDGLREDYESVRSNLDKDLNRLEQKVIEGAS